MQTGSAWLLSGRAVAHQAGRPVSELSSESIEEGDIEQLSVWHWRGTADQDKLPIIFWFYQKVLVLSNGYVPYLRRVIKAKLTTNCAHLLPLFCQSLVIYPDCCHGNRSALWAGATGLLNHSFSRVKVTMTRPQITTYWCHEYLWIWWRELIRHQQVCNVKGTVHVSVRLVGGVLRGIYW